MTKPTVRLSLCACVTITLSACGTPSARSTGVATSDYCGQAKPLRSLGDAIQPVYGSDTADLSLLKKNAQSITDALDRLAAAAKNTPIAADARTIAGAWDSTDRLLQQATASSDWSALEWAAVANRDAIKAAGQRINAYTSAQCGFTVSSGALGGM